MNESHDNWDRHGKRKIIIIKLTKKNHLHQSQPYPQKLHPHFQTNVDDKTNM